MAGCSHRRLLKRVSQMLVSVNGNPIKCAEHLCLDALIAQCGIDGDRFATAVNGCFVARNQRRLRELQPGDQIMTFEPITGG